MAPLLAQAQGIPQGAANGANAGNKAAGPVGAVVGGVVGGVLGGIGGLLGADERPRFHQYAMSQRHPSYRYDKDFVVGAVLPRQGVTYYAVPDEYGARDYRYTIVNDHAVLVDPRTGAIVEILD